MPSLEDWATTVTLAHLRVPRIEMMEYDSIDEYRHVVVKLVLDKAMTALVSTTFPVHDRGESYAV